MLPVSGDSVMNQLATGPVNDSEFSRPQLRVALTIHSLQGGGAERMMAQLANHWASRCEVHLITWASKHTDRYRLDPKIHRHGLAMQATSLGLADGMLANLKRIRRLRKELGSLRPDLVVSFCDQMNIVCLEATRRFPSLPVWIAEHSDPIRQQLSPLWEVWRRRSYSRCTGAIVLTEQIAEAMSRWVPSHRVRVIPPALADNAGFDFGYRHVTENGRRVLLYVGRLSPEKRVDLLLQAWAHLHPQLPDWELKIVGDGPERRNLDQMSKDSPRVTFTGWTDQPGEFYRASQAFMMCSEYEGFPVALLEAMSFGLPCISTRSSSAIALLQAQSGSSALRVVENSSVPELAAAMLQLAKDDSALRGMSIAARHLAANYTWEKVSPCWDVLLGDVIH